jgi:hypothetical protein
VIPSAYPDLARRRLRRSDGPPPTECAILPGESVQFYSGVDTISRGFELYRTPASGNPIEQAARFVLGRSVFMGCVLATGSIFIALGLFPDTALSLMPGRLNAWLSLKPGQVNWQPVIAGAMYAFPALGLFWTKRRRYPKQLEKGLYPSGEGAA